MQSIPRAGFVLACFLVACTSTTNNNPPSGGGGTPVSTADCKDKCKSKATSCNATPSDAEQGCTQICGGSITSDQIDCLESKSCDALQKAKNVGVMGPFSFTEGRDPADTSGVVILEMQGGKFRIFGERS